MPGEERHLMGERKFAGMPENISISRYPDDSPAYLDSLRRNKLKPDDYEDIIRICNQNGVKKWLFEQLLGDEPYTIDNLNYWLDDLADMGWRQGSAFVYVIRNSNDKIVGAIDIKTNDINGAEIGYWADETEPGYMTSAGVALIQEAKQAGYKKLFAIVGKGNNKSSKTLLRIGFNLVSDNYEYEGRILDYYEIVLNESN
jgi:RimJ/RimL family protein N-acetyltransferase